MSSVHFFAGAAVHFGYGGGWVEKMKTDARAFNCAQFVPAMFAGGAIFDAQK